MAPARLTRTLFRADGPLYRQVAQRLRAAIAAGRIAVGEELPTEAALAKGFAVSLITLRHALRELEAEGLIQKRPAKPAIVTSAEPRAPAVRSLNSLEDIVAATEGATLEIAGWRPLRSARAAREFGLDPTTPCPCLRGRMLLAGAPLSEVTIFFPPELGRQLSRRDFDDVVVFRAVQRRLGIVVTGARVTVRAEVADAALARRLDYTEGAPVLVSEIIFLDAGGQPVEFTTARHRADRYSLSYAFATR